MKKLISSLFCGLLLAQSVNTHTINFSQPIHDIQNTWETMDPTYKKWIKVATKLAIASGSVCLSVYGISLLKNACELREQLRAENAKIVNELIEKCFTARKTLLIAECTLPEEGFDALYKEIQQEISEDCSKFLHGGYSHEIDKFNEKIAFNMFKVGAIAGGLFTLIIHTITN